MSLQFLHTYSDNDPNGTARDAFIKSVENPDGKGAWVRPYYDTSIAIAYGFDLLVHNDASIISYLNKVNDALGLTGSQRVTLTLGDKTLLSQARGYASQVNSLLKQLKTASGQQRVIINQQINLLRGQINSISSQLSLTFPSETYAARLLNIIMNEYETALDNALGFCMTPSKEKTAILSLLYSLTEPTVAAITNKKHGIPSTLAAIKNDNRAEAWYEIRYNSNLDGQHAGRRYEESYLFGLYDNTPTFTEGEAKEVMRMFTRHELLETDASKKMTAYESKYSPGEYADIRTNIQDARNYLITSFAGGIGVNIDGEVIVGAGLTSYAYKEGANINDVGNRSLNGTNKNDLIFGEAGDDSINGGSGNDIIYGGYGKDSLIGGLGDDILLGGEGNDKYYYHAGDGNDSIIDTEGDNKIIVVENDGSQQTLGNVYREGTTNVYTTVNGKVKITHNSPWQMVMEDGSTVNLGENFQPGNFGINLLNMPDAPTNTILGDFTPTSDPPQYDSLGNVIVDPNTPSPDRNDYLYDSTANDRIEGKGGNDILHAIRGGDDLLAGGEGNDIILAGEGNDNVFGENEGEMDDLVTAGETAQNINEKGDLATGSVGNDLVYGSNRKDALFGGAGFDLLVGGGGDDLIYGDSHATAAFFSWSYAIDTHGGMLYEPVFTNAGYDAGEYDESGDDVVYVGAGNDFVYGAGKGDEVYVEIETYVQ